MIVYRKQNFIISDTFMACTQRAKKLPGLVDFVIGLVNSVFNLPDGQVMFLSNSNRGRTLKSILLIKKLLGLVQIMSGLVNASFSLPKGQAIIMIFFAPCIQQLNQQQKLQMFDWNPHYHGWYSPCQSEIDPEINYNLCKTKPCILV